MSRKNPNKKYLNKLFSLKVLGKGDKGDFMGKIDGVVCFISDLKGQRVKFDDVVDVKVTYVTDKVLFAEAITYEDNPEVKNGKKES